MEEERCQNRKSNGRLCGNYTIEMYYYGKPLCRGCWAILSRLRPTAIKMQLSIDEPKAESDMITDTTA